MNDYENYFNNQIPTYGKDTTLVLKFKVQNLKSEYLNKPLDKLFREILTTSTLRLAEELDARSAYNTKDDIILFIRHDKSISQQEYLSKATSILSVEFYKALLSCVLEYEGKVNELRTDHDDLQDAFDSVTKRLENLWGLLNNPPIFNGKLFLVPLNMEIEILQEIQEENIANIVNDVGLYCINTLSLDSDDEDAVNDAVTNATMLKEYLLNQGVDPYKFFDDTDLNGSIIYKDEDEFLVSVANIFADELE